MTPKYFPLRGHGFDYEATENNWESGDGRRKLTKWAAISVILLLLATNIATLVHYSTTSRHTMEPIPQDYGTAAAQ